MFWPKLRSVAGNITWCPSLPHLGTRLLGAGSSYALWEHPFANRGPWVTWVDESFWLAFWELTLECRAVGQRFIWKVLGVHTCAEDREAEKGEGEVEP